MKFVKTTTFIFAVPVGLFLFLFYIGTPTTNDRYLEQNTKKSAFIAFSDSLAKCEIRVIPEVLNRLIIQIKLEHLTSGNEIVKDIDLKVLRNRDEQKRIFDISISKRLESTGNTDEIRINKYSDLPLTSKYRDFSYTIQPQYELAQNDKFDIELTITLMDSLSKKARTFDSTYSVRNDKQLKMERLRFH